MNSKMIIINWEITYIAGIFLMLRGNLTKHNLAVDCVLSNLSQDKRWPSEKNMTWYVHCCQLVKICELWKRVCILRADWPFHVRMWSLWWQAVSIFFGFLKWKYLSSTFHWMTNSTTYHWMNLSVQINKFKSWRYYDMLLRQNCLGKFLFAWVN